MKHICAASSYCPRNQGSGGHSFRHVSGATCYVKQRVGCSHMGLGQLPKGVSNDKCC